MSAIARKGRRVAGGLILSSLALNIGINCGWPLRVRIRDPIPGVPNPRGHLSRSMLLERRWSCTVGGAGPYHVFASLRFFVAEGTTL